jgi:hypothetical protein
MLATRREQLEAAAICRGDQDDRFKDGWIKNNSSGQTGYFVSRGVYLMENIG